MGVNRVNSSPSKEWRDIKGKVGIIVSSTAAISFIGIGFWKICLFFFFYIPKYSFIFLYYFSYYFYFLPIFLTIKLISPKKANKLVNLKIKLVDSKTRIARFRVSPLKRLIETVDDLSKPKK